MEEWIKLNNEVNQLDENGNTQYYKDIEATRSYFVNHVNKKMQFFEDFDDKMDYMLENNYYKRDVIESYPMEFIKELDTFLKAQKFRFKSFMASQKFYEDYALKTDDGERILERYEDRVLMNALTLANGNQDMAKLIAKQMIQQTIQPATPTFLNTGRSRGGKFISCFLLRMEDNTESINYVFESASQLSRFGGGVAIDMSYLRGKDESIMEIEGASTSTVLIAKILENISIKFNQLGQRDGAFAVYMNALHIDAIDLLNAKKINADETARLKKLSIGLTIPDIVYTLAEQNKDYFAFYPHSVFKEYGIALADMDMEEYYYKLLENKNVRKKNMGSARAFLEEIARTHIESGYPYILNIDTANKSHLLKDIGKINMSNLCVEILQLSTPSEIFHRGKAEMNKYGEDILCNLLSLNISNVMKHKDEFAEILHTSVDMASSVSDNSNVDEVPSVRNGKESYNAIGIGAMNLHGYLAESGIMYESFEAIDFVNTFFSTMRYYGLQRSMEIAKVKGAFKNFKKSEYAKGHALDLYINKSHAPQSEKVKALFDGMYIPTQEDWKKLNKEIIDNGLYNSYLFAIAPTGSISYLQNATPSVLPITKQVEVRETGKSTVFYPMPNLNAKTKWYYKTAYQTDMRKMIDLVSVIQRHVDQSISTTLFVNAKVMKTGDLASLFVYAHKRGLKTIYYSRTTDTEDEFCSSCVI